MFFKNISKTNKNPMLIIIYEINTDFDSVLNIANCGRLAIKPPSTSRILRLSNGNIYFLSFSSESVNQERLSVVKTKK
jgi:hypothetical protein